MEAERLDRLRFWIHLIFGAFIGALTGVVILFAWFSALTAVSLFLFCVWTLTIALLGGLYGDRFWDALGRLYRFFTRWDSP